MTIIATPDFWKLHKGKPETLDVGSVEIVASTWDKKNKKGKVRALEVLSEKSVRLGTSESRLQ